MTHPILRPGPYPFWRDEATLLWRRLFERFADQQVIARLYASCAENLRPLNLGQGPDLVWQQALEELARADLLTRLIEVVRAEGALGVLAEPIDRVETAQPLVKVRIISSNLLVLDRKPLEDRLGELGEDTNPAKVVLVRGQPKSGKTHGRYLFERAARDQGADALYLSFGMGVATVEDAVLWLFSSLEADDAVPAGDSTDTAWYGTVSRALLRRVRERGRPAWIAVDDLGPGPDGSPLMDDKIRKFFELLAVQLLNPAFRPWLRLMLIHYPDRPPPTGWQQELWCEDRPDETSIGHEDVVALIRSWASGRRGTGLPDDHVQDAAAQVLAAVATAAAEPHPQPRLQLLHTALVAKLRTLEAAES
jgi:hypothetical protein